MKNALVEAARVLCHDVDELHFDAPVTNVYNPLRYAQDPHHHYLKKFGIGRGQNLWLGMNPGPWGMAQTGIPFGEVAAVRDYLRIGGTVSRPENAHPKRPVEGFGCSRSEVSGRRLWSLMQSRYPTVDDFFAAEILVNYCPLVFMEESGRNRTPDKLPRQEREPLMAACDRHLSRCIEIVRPRWLVAVGTYAEKCGQRQLEVASEPFQICRVLHPSPASPAANRDWAGRVDQTLRDAGVWK